MPAKQFGFVNKIDTKNTTMQSEMNQPIRLKGKNSPLPPDFSSKLL